MKTNENQKKEREDNNNYLDREVIAPLDERVGGIAGRGFAPPAAPPCTEASPSARAASSPNEASEDHKLSSLRKRTAREEKDRMSHPSVWEEGSPYPSRVSSEDRTAYSLFALFWQHYPDTSIEKDWGASWAAWQQEIGDNPAKVRQVFEALSALKEERNSYPSMWWFLAPENQYGSYNHDSYLNYADEIEEDEHPDAQEESEKQDKASKRVKCAGITTDGSPCNIAVHKEKQYCGLHKNQDPEGSTVAIKTCNGLTAKGGKCCKRVIRGAEHCEAHKWQEGIDAYSVAASYYMGLSDRRGIINYDMLRNGIARVSDEGWTLENLLSELVEGYTYSKRTQERARKEAA